LRIDSRYSSPFLIIRIPHDNCARRSGVVSAVEPAGGVAD
jgi:hypothetical protein